MSIMYGNQDPYGLSGIGQLLGQYLGQNQAQSRQKKDFSVLGEALAKEPTRGEAGFGPMDAPDSAIQRILMAAQAQGVDPRSLQQFLGQSPGQAYIQEQELIQKKAIAEQSALQKMLPKQLEIAEKQQDALGAIGTINRMRELGSSGNLGRGSHALSVFGGQRAKDVGEYERLGKSLISYASTIPIRNRAEFETLAASLYDASIPDSERAGVLNAMEQIISRSIGVNIDPSSGKPSNKPKTLQDVEQSKRPPLTSFNR